MIGLTKDCVYLYRISEDNGTKHTTEATCTDPESFVRGDPTFTMCFLAFSGGIIYHKKLAIIGPPAVLLACQ